MVEGNQKIYRLVDKKGHVIVQGTYEECHKKEKDVLEYIGIGTPVYRATNNKGLDITGTVQEIAQKTKISYRNLYNYSRFKRKHDGLYLTKVDYKIIKQEVK